MPHILSTVAHTTSPKGKNLGILKQGWGFPGLGFRFFFFFFFFFVVVVVFFFFFFFFFVVVFFFFFFFFFFCFFFFVFFQISIIPYLNS